VIRNVPDLQSAGTVVISDIRNQAAEAVKSFASRRYHRHSNSL